MSEANPDYSAHTYTDERGGLLVPASEILTEIKEEMEEVASAMLNGVANWDEYQRLVGRASALADFAETIRARDNAHQGAQG